jgi:hypothetical protein
MLTSLQNYDQREVANVMAALALASAPNPTDTTPDLVQQYQPLLKSLEAEIKARLRIPLDDTSVIANGRYNAEVAKLLTSAIIDNKDESTILARAGQYGRLAPSQYRVDVSTLFPEFPKLGIRPAHILDAIHNADDVQHLQVEGQIEKPFSLFMRVIRSRRPSDVFWLLVYTHRGGAVQFVQHAWRIYIEDVPMEGARTPLDVLRAFTSKFGVWVSVGTERTKLVVDKVINAPVEGERADLFSVHLDYPNQRTIYTFSAANLTNAQRTYVKIGYAINLRKYIEYLVSHNVDVSHEMLQNVGLARFRDLQGLLLER